MPYIVQTQRDLIDKEITELVAKIESLTCALDFSEPSLKGVLNYTLTRIFLGIYNNPKNRKLNYSRINDIVGILECVKLEFYRRPAAGYEDNKISENGDVYK